MRWNKAGWLAALFLGACCAPPNPTPDAGPGCGMQVEWGHRRSCVFRPFAAQETALITTGFQGFRFLQTTVRFREAPVQEARLVFDVTVDGHAPFSQPAGVFGLRLGSDGARYAEDVLVFFDDTPQSELVGRAASVVVTATAATCIVRQTSSINLGADPNLHDGGTSVCADGG